MLGRVHWIFKVVKSINTSKMIEYQHIIDIIERTSPIKAPKFSLVLIVLPEINFLSAAKQLVNVLTATQQISSVLWLVGDANLPDACISYQPVVFWVLLAAAKPDSVQFFIFLPHQQKKKKWS